VGKVIFDRPGTIHVGGRHLGFAQWGQNCFKLAVPVLDAPDQVIFFNSFGDGFSHESAPLLTWNDAASSIALNAAKISPDSPNQHKLGGL
jgi:hypothetical protein